MADQAQTPLGAPLQPPLFVKMTILRPVTILVVMVAFLVIGGLAYPRIPLQLIPQEFSRPSCFVFIPVPEATPHEVARRVSEPCEEELRRISGVRNVVTTASATQCTIRIEFSAQVDPQVMVAEIRDRIERARSEWIEGIDRYFLWRQSESAIPVFMCAVSMSVDESKVDLDYIFEEVIAKRLATVDGVARVNTWGLLEKFVEISLDPNRVDAHGVDLYEFVRKFAADNQTVNAGRIFEGDQELFVRFDGRFRSFDEVSDAPLNEAFRVSDIAKVDFGYSVKDQLSRANGNRSRALIVYKESSANAVEVCGRIAHRLEEIGADLKRSSTQLTGFEVHSWLDQGEMIRLSIASLARSALWGGAFAVLVLFVFFRRFGMTLLVALAIPFSLLITIVWIFFRGGTFNLMSLTGLTLGIGMLVDNSIVIVENIARKMDVGGDTKSSVVDGVREVGVAVSLATMTTIMVFLPILFIGDPRFKVIATEVIEPVCVSVLASLVVALVFVPQGARFAHFLSASRGKYRSVSQVCDYSVVNRASAVLTRWCVGHRVETFLLVVLLMVLSSFGYTRLPKSTISGEGRRPIEARVELPKNSSLAEANETFAAIEDAVLKKKEELQIRSVTSWFRATGGVLNVFLAAENRVEEEDFFAKLKPILPSIAGVNYRFGFEDFANDQGMARVRVFLQGEDLSQLERVGARVRNELNDHDQFPELDDVKRWRSDERDEIQVHVARQQAQKYGVDTASVSRMVAWALRGARLPDFLDDDREYPFWIRYGARVKEDASELDAIRVFREDGEFVRLENVANYAVTPGMGEIHRMNGKMTIGFSARVDGKVEKAKRKLERHFRRFPGGEEGVEISLTRKRGGFEHDMSNLQAALLMAVALVFFSMGVLFESFVLPLAVLCVVPFGICSSIGLLWALGMSFDVVGMIGMLILLGIVVNNAIVLVDQVNRLRSQGLRRREAILEGVKIRFRPIWMTALTTIFGLLPLLLFPQRGDGVDYKPIAVVLVGGLTTSTFFTLYIVPLFYCFFDDVAVGLRRLVRAAWSRGLHSECKSLHGHAPDSIT